MGKLYRKKLVMLGGFGVGKTSLVSRFVSNEFSEEYQSTIGAKIEKSTVIVGEDTVELNVWDIAGEDELASVSPAQVRGAAAVFFVIDSTRSGTVLRVKELFSRFSSQLDGIPLVVALNKFDLEKDLEMEAALKTLPEFWRVVPTSAKTGQNVAESFQWLAEHSLSTGKGK